MYMIEIMISIFLRVQCFNQHVFQKFQSFCIGFNLSRTTFRVLWWQLFSERCTWSLDNLTMRTTGCNFNILPLHSASASCIILLVLCRTTCSASANKIYIWQLQHIQQLLLIYYYTFIIMSLAFLWPLPLQLRHSRLATMKSTVIALQAENALLRNVEYTKATATSRRQPRLSVFREVEIDFVFSKLHNFTIVIVHFCIYLFAIYIFLLAEITRHAICKRH
jgi:hypothetical protein